MAFALSWHWYNTSGSTWTAFGATDIIGFFATPVYGVKISVSSYNQGMHLIDSGTGLDACIANHLTGIQYIAAGTCKVNGGSTVNLNTVTTQESVRISLTDGATSISTENTKIFAYDGSVEANAPTDTTFQCAEQGESSWTQAEGSASAKSLADQLTPAVTKYWYLIMSVMPETVGTKDNKIKFSTDYY